MPDRKHSESCLRKTINQKRTKAKNTNYQFMKIIKTYNHNKEPIGFMQLCALSDHHTVVKFIKQAHAWAMIENRWEVSPATPDVVLQVTSVGDAFIKYCETKKQE